MTIVRRPAMKAGWKIQATIAVLDDTLPVEALRNAIETAGLYVGVGSWRPEFGRFVLREWAIDRPEVKAAKKK